MTAYLIFSFTAVASLPLGWRLVTKISFSFLLRIINSLDPSLYCVLFHKLQLTACESEILWELFAFNICPYGEPFWKWLVVSKREDNNSFSWSLWFIDKKLKELWHKSKIKLALLIWSAHIVFPQVEGMGSICLSYAEFSWISKGWDSRKSWDHQTMVI